MSDPASPPSPAPLPRPNRVWNPFKLFKTPTLSSISHAPPEPTPKSSLRRFMGYVRPYFWTVAISTVLGVLRFILPVTASMAIVYVVNHLMTSADVAARKPDSSTRLMLTYLDWLAARLPPGWHADTPLGRLNGLMVSLLVIYVLWGIAFYVRNYLTQLVGHRVILDLRTDLYNHITRLSHSFFQSNQSGGIVSRLMSDIALAQNFVGNAMTNIWMDTATCVFYIAVLALMDVPLTLVSLCVFPFYIASMRTFGRSAKRTTKEVQEKLEAFSGDVQERVAGINVVKSFAAEGRESRTFFHGARELFDLTMRSVKVTTMSQTLSQWLTQVATLVVLWFGGYRIVKGAISPGEVSAFVFLLRELYMPMNRISELNTVINNSLAAIDRVFEVFDITADVQESPNAVKLSRLKGRITFDKVTFGYEEDRPVLSNIRLDVQPGEVVALVGSSGAGKSTMVQLVPRFYDPQKGRVLVDDIDLRDVTLRSLRSQVGVVAQETLLFSGSVRENLLYGRPGASDKEMLRAARAAHAHEFIERLPDGYETALGERGARLSGGQKQRLAIARAFLTDPRILILDEATSALDSESEALIQEALTELMKQRTSIVIAHRLSTILGSDRIAVMHMGRIVDIGPHEELLERNEIYANLYNTQFRVVLATTE